MAVLELGEVGGLAPDAAAELAEGDAAPTAHVAEALAEDERIERAAVHREVLLIFANTARLARSVLDTNRESFASWAWRSLHGLSHGSPPIPTPTRCFPRPPRSSSATCTAASTAPARALLAARQRASGALRRRRAPGVPRRDRRRPGRRVAGARGAQVARRPAGRDHRTGRAEDDDQRPQLGGTRLHGRLRGRQLADLGRTSSKVRSTSLDAVRGTISLETAERTYRLNEETATLVVRPRGWHLVEKHLEIDGLAISASLFDAGLYLFHNARETPVARLRPVPLPPEAREPPRGRASGRTSSRYAESGARSRPRLDPGHRAHRDDHRRLRDGRDPLRTARPHLRSERRSLGLHLQHRQALPRRPGLRAAGSGVR